MSYKKDYNLGLNVAAFLKSKEVETPMVNEVYGDQDKFEIIEKSFKDILHAIGLDLSDDSIKDTPSRVAKMYVKEIFEGLDYVNFPKCTTVSNKFKCDEMVIVKGIDVSSTCEHHFQNIEGVAKIAYIPNEKVIGLSKLNRVVRFFSKRPQIQERLTMQIFYALSYILETDNIAVEISAVHHCVCSRGIEDKNTSTSSRHLGGCFKNEPETRAEFLNS